MSAPSIRVEVANYEDATINNKEITYYIVSVHDTKANQTTHFKKRYSDFQKLHTGLKERFPQIELFKFPKKSVFNTRSEFTKVRRRQGFDDFLKVLVQLQPMPEEVEIFLGMSRKKDTGRSSLFTLSRASENDSRDSLAQNGSSSTGTSDGLRRKPNALGNGSSESATKAGLHQRRSGKPLMQRLKNIPDDESSDSGDNPSIQFYFVTKILPTTFVGITSIYAGMIALKVVDISSTDITRVAMTIICLAFAISFLWLGLILRNERL
jgi:hypothetical protein